MPLPIPPSVAAGAAAGAISAAGQAIGQVVSSLKQPKDDAVSSFAETLQSATPTSENSPTGLPSELADQLQHLLDLLGIPGGTLVETKLDQTGEATISSDAISPGRQNQITQLLQQSPELQNKLTEYLRTQPNQSASILTQTR